MAAAAGTAAHTLIVEDDADTCEAMVGMLRAEGLEAECARTVGEALVELEIGSKPRRCSWTWASPTRAARS